MPRAVSWGPLLRTCEAGRLVAFWGSLALWRPPADVLRVMPSKAIEFTAFDAYKRVLGQRDPATGKYSCGHAGSALAGGAAGEAPN